MSTEMPRPRIARTNSIMRDYFGGIQSGEHFVQQNRFRLGGQRPRHLQAFLAADGEFPRGCVGPIRQPGLFEYLARHLAGLLERKVLRAEAGADDYVLQHGQIVQRFYDLVSPRQPCRGHFRLAAIR